MQNDKGPAAPSVLVIDRSQWLRGEGDSVSALRRPRDGKMCCLGFEAIACGYSEQAITNMPDPESVDPDPTKSRWPVWLAYEATDDHGEEVLKNTAECDALIKANDDETLPEREREAKIAAIFAEHGVEVRFVDGTEQPPAGPSAISSDSAAADTEGDDP